MKELTLVKENEMFFKKQWKRNVYVCRYINFVLLVIYLMSELRGTIAFRMYVNSSMGL